MCLCVTLPDKTKSKRLCDTGRQPPGSDVVTEMIVAVKVLKNIYCFSFF